VIRKAAPTVLLAALFILASLSPMLVGCGPSHKAKTIKASFITLKAAHAGFVEWDTTQQDKIIEKATSLEDGQAKLKKYREEQTKIYAAIAKALQLLLDASTDEDVDPGAAIREGTRVIEVIEQFKDQP
jgi:hypothetical protein